MTGDGISFRELARRLGVSEKAVRKAEAAGVFPAGVVRREDGSAPVVVNLTAAIAAWQLSGRALRGRRAIAVWSHRGVVSARVRIAGVSAVLELEANDAAALAARLQRAAVAALRDRATGPAVDGREESANV